MVKPSDRYGIYHRLSDVIINLIWLGITVQVMVSLPGCDVYIPIPIAEFKEHDSHAN